MREFINLAWQVPLVKLDRVTVRSAMPNKPTRSHGSCIELIDGDYAICIHHNYTRIKSTKPLIWTMGRFSTIDILDNLAHELAHLRYWKHTIKHKELELEIMEYFLHHLDDAGYISEEHEAITRKYFGCKT